MILNERDVIVSSVMTFTDIINSIVKKDLQKECCVITEVYIYNSLSSMCQYYIHNIDYKTDSKASHSSY